MPAVEGAVKRRLVKPVDRMFGTRTRPASRKKKATAASRKKTSSKKTSGKKAAPKTTTHKTRSAKRAPAKKSSRKTAGRKKRF